MALTENALVWAYIGDGNTPNLGYSIQKIYVGTHQVRPAAAQTVQTFDFQNDWALNRTGATIYGTPTYVTWEWWSLSNSSGDSQTNIVPPSSIYNNGTLKTVKIWFYKWILDSGLPAQWAWVSSTGLTPNSLRSQSGTSTSKWSFYNRNTWEVPVLTPGMDYVGEHVLLFTFNDSSTQLKLNLDGTDLTMPVNGSATVFQTCWSNQALYLGIWSWRDGGHPCYIRKCEITTLD